MSWSGQPVLCGRHVTLRPLARADRAGLLAAFASLPHVYATFVPGPDTINDWYERIEREAAAGRATAFTVLDASGEIAGTTRFMRINPDHRRLEIGGTVYAAHVQRTGLTTEAKRLLLGHAFETMGAGCVQLRTSWLNRASRQAIERLGARRDGVLRGHMIDAQGNARDTVVYSILAHEWPQIRHGLDIRLEEGERQ